MARSVIVAQNQEIWFYITTTRLKYVKVSFGIWFIHIGPVDTSSTDIFVGWNICYGWIKFLPTLFFIHMASAGHTGTLGYHICLTISSNCLVQRFLLIVAILYWGPRVIIICTWDGLWMWPRSRDDMDHGAWTWAVCVDPGPLGHMMDSPCAWAVLRSISNDPGLFSSDPGLSCHILKPA